jgi:hypothetical protein
MAPSVAEAEHPVQLTAIEATKAAGKFIVKADPVRSILES